MIGTGGEARWHAPDPEGEFAYLEFLVDAIAYNVAPEASGNYDELPVSTVESSISGRNRHHER